MVNKNMVNNRGNHCYFKHLNRLILSVFILLVSGCGGSSRSSLGLGGDEGDQISGKVMDGYIENARVFLDLNGNLQKDDGEPEARSDADGNYTLDVTDSSRAKTTATVMAIIGSDAIDKDTGYGFPSTFSMTSVPGQKQINPLTTMARQLGGETVTKAQAEGILKNLLGEQVDVSQDDVANSNSVDGTQKALARKIHKQAQVIARLQVRLSEAHAAITAFNQQQKQKLAANVIAEKMEDIKREAARIKDGETASEDVVLNIGVEVTTTVASLRDKLGKIRAKEEVGLKNPIRYLGMMHWHDPDTAGNTKPGTWVDLAFGEPTISSSEYTFIIEKAGTTYALTARGNNNWDFDEADGIDKSTGTWNLIAKRGDSTAVISTTELKDPTAFYDAVAVETATLNITVDENDRVLSIIWDRVSTAQTQMYGRITVRRKGDAHKKERLFGGRRAGTIFSMPSEVKENDYKASDLLYRFELWDGRRFVQSNAAKQLTKWRDFPPKANNAGDVSAYIHYYRLYYRTKPRSSNRHRRQPVFQFEVRNADAIKKIRFKRGDVVVYSSTINIDIEDQTCNGKKAPTIITSQVNTHQFSFGCAKFLNAGDDYEAGAKQVDFYGFARHA